MEKETFSKETIKAVKENPSPQPPSEIDITKVASAEDPKKEAPTQTPEVKSGKY